MPTASKPLSDADGLAGAVIAEARAASDLTQHELAARVGRRQAWLSCIEHGDQPCTLDQFVTLARAMGKNPAVLVSYYEHLLQAHKPAHGWFRASTP